MSDERNPPSSSAIVRSGMMAPLLEADPSFGIQWTAFEEEWREAPEPPLYVVLATLARHLIRHHAAGTSDQFGAVFDVVERWIVEGDEFVQEAAVIGLLEGLQNDNLHETTQPSDFVRWLRPHSRKAWDDLNAFWNGTS